MIAPGQAQPYYQGDPLPVMQSATAPPNNNLATASDTSAALSSTGKTLGWNSPIAGAPVAAAQQPAAAQVAMATPPPFGPTPAAESKTYGNEPAIAVPADADALRFALPAPVNSEPATPIAAPAMNTTQLAQPTAATQNQGVLQASYNAPVTSGANSLAPPGDAAAMIATPQIDSPWRSPEVPKPSAVPNYGLQPHPLPVAGTQQIAPSSYVPAPVVVPTNPVAVQLRAVPSPPPQPGDPNPRIRIPGYEVPQTATADGFRPRSTMR